LTQILPSTFARGSCEISSAFGKISVKKKLHRAQPALTKLKLVVLLILFCFATGLEKQEDNRLRLLWFYKQLFFSLLYESINTWQAVFGPKTA
jgi:hypothetical protein